MLLRYGDGLLFETVLTSNYVNKKSYQTIKNHKNEAKNIQFAYPIFDGTKH
jgi:hypothetical protein